MARDGETLGEVMMRGNVVMKGYLKNKASTEQAFAGGWFHSGDLGVMHPDGYIQLKDRSKDIIISGGENISSIEVEDALYKHPAVPAAAVVAKPDDKWGETPCAFVELKPGAQATADELMPGAASISRATSAAPRGVRRNAEDQHRQDPEIQAARDGEGGVIALGGFLLTENMYMDAKVSGLDVSNACQQSRSRSAASSGNCRRKAAMTGVSS